MVTTSVMDVSASKQQKYKMQMLWMRWHHYDEQAQVDDLSTPITWPVHYRVEKNATLHTTGGKKENLAIFDSIKQTDHHPINSGQTICLMSRPLQDLTCV